MTTDDRQQQAEARLNQGLLDHWYPVAKSVDVAPEVPHARKILGRNLVLWRGADGRVRCVEDRCPHRGAPLSRGRLRGEHISCRYHGVTLDGDGVIVEVPALGNCGLKGRKAIAGYPVVEKNGAVFAYFARTGQDVTPPLDLPIELTDPEYETFLCAAPWNCSYRYVLDNLVDPMHGIYLHGDTFTLSEGLTRDLVEVESTGTRFVIKRVGQQGTNLDWMEFVAADHLLYGRVVVPYPPAGGPGGAMFVITFVTPVDEEHCLIYFWRVRRVSGLAREAWRFLYRTTFEQRHWHVLEQDRELISAMPPDARDRELLYQHDLGVSKMRRILAQKARDQIQAEQDAAAGSTTQ